MEVIMEIYDLVITIRSQQDELKPREFFSEAQTPW